MTENEQLINRYISNSRVSDKVELYHILENSKCEPQTLEKLFIFFNKIDRYLECDGVKIGSNCPAWGYCSSKVRDEIIDEMNEIEKE